MSFEESEERPTLTDLANAHTFLAGMKSAKRLNREDRQTLYRVLCQKLALDRKLDQLIHPPKGRRKR